MSDLWLRFSIWLTGAPERLIEKNEQMKAAVTPEQKAKRKRAGKIGYSLSAAVLLIAGGLYLLSLYLGQ